MKHLMIGLTSLCSLLTFGAKAQHTETVHGVTATPPQVILTEVLNSPGLKDQQVTMVIVTLAPGETAGSHRHPVPTFAYVLEGEFDSTFEGKVYHYKAGDAFYEFPDGLHGPTKNTGSKTVKLLAFHVGDKSKAPTVPVK